MIGQKKKSVDLQDCCRLGIASNQHNAYVALEGARICSPQTCFLGMWIILSFKPLRTLRQRQGSKRRAAASLSPSEQFILRCLSLFFNCFIFYPPFVPLHHRPFIHPSVFGCTGPTLLCAGFLWLQQSGAALRRGAVASLTAEHRASRRCGS